MDPFQQLASLASGSYAVQAPATPKPGSGVPPPIVELAPIADSGGADQPGTEQAAPAAGKRRREATRPPGIDVVRASPPIAERQTQETSAERNRATAEEQVAPPANDLRQAEPQPANFERELIRQDAADGRREFVVRVRETSSPAAVTGLEEVAEIAHAAQPVPVAGPRPEGLQSAATAGAEGGLAAPVAVRAAPPLLIASEDAPADAPADRVAHVTIGRIDIRVLPPAPDKKLSASPPTEAGPARRAGSGRL